MEEEITARLTIFGLPTMKHQSMKILVRWLRRLADEIEKEKDRKVYNARLVARLFK